jgi:putative ABC transport system ATP-binding protein
MALPDGNAVVSLRDVSKIYRGPAGDFTALTGVNLRVGPGEFVAIMGKSGSGKSTLINVITGIDRPTSGEVFVAGTPVHTLSEEQIAVWRGRTIGVVFQFFQLLPALTAVENVLLAMDYGQRYPMRERPERAMALLERVGVTSQAHALPSALSGGELQRVAIARALANDPPILTADEPTGNLDSVTAERVLELFEELVEEGTTVLMVTHDRELATRARRIVVLADGEVMTEAAPLPQGRPVPRARRRGSNITSTGRTDETGFSVLYPFHPSATPPGGKG